MWNATADLLKALDLIETIPRCCEMKNLKFREIQGLTESHICHLVRSLSGLGPL